MLNEFANEKPLESESTNNMPSVVASWKDERSRQAWAEIAAAINVSEINCCLCESNFETTSVLPKQSFSLGLLADALKLSEVSLLSVEMQSQVPKVLGF